MRALEPEIGTSCDLCQSAQRMEDGEDQFAIARLSTGYVSLCATQHFVGYTFFSTKLCVPEIHDLAKATRTVHLHEMAEVAHALARAFNPRKLNYEALGNGTPHLHWHLIPRYATDPHPRGPVWEDLSFLRKFWLGGAPPDEQTDAARKLILEELRVADVEIEREYVAL
jgi:diadenosine tetraphosphate (Ap4A) HIT family hydrolase